MKKHLLLISALLFSGMLSAAPTASEVALKRLMDGNARYVKELHEHPNRSQERRDIIASSQEPIAVVVGCSDSRVSPVIVFDQGLGDIFEVRVAGNVVGPIEIASAEFGADVLHAPLILVLGHENCAAVRAVAQGQTEDIEPIAVKIEPAIRNIPNGGDQNLAQAIKANVNAVVNELKANKAIAGHIAEKKLQVVGGYYNLNTGKVELCCDLPAEATQK